MKTEQLEALAKVAGVEVTTSNTGVVHSTLEDDNTYYKVWNPPQIP